MVGSQLYLLVEKPKDCPLIVWMVLGGAECPVQRAAIPTL